MSHSTPLRFVAFFQALGFLAVLVLPLVATNFQAGHQRSDTENRDLNDFPKWEWNAGAMDAFPSKFEAAFNDHFGFRALFTRWHSLAKVYGFGVSPVEKVTLGKEGWLFLSESLKEYRGVKQIKDTSAEGWARELQAKRAWLAARGIHYLLVVAPNKEEVYPEYLPNNICRLRERRYLDEILKKAGPDFRENIVDLREPLRQGKKMGLVYDRTDTHWSHLGVFLATNEIVSRLQKWDPELKPAPLDQRPQSPLRGGGGDLARMVGLQNQMFEERLAVSPAPAPYPTGVMRFKQEWPEDSLQDPPMIFEGAGRLTVLITGDSFGRGLLEFLPAHCRRVVRLRPDVPYNPWFQGLLPGLVEAEKPDIYLDVFCSRGLRNPPKALFPGR